MQKITPDLWYDKEAKAAAELYTSAFENSKIDNITTLQDTPSGDADIVNITLAGQKFSLISAGPYFKFTPAISFMVACSTKEEVEKLWNILSKDGKVLMELQEYPFSKYYGWTEDKFGLSWQIILTDQPITQKITPSLLFVQNVCGRAEEAIHFYTSIFPNSKIGEIARYEQGEVDKEGNIKYASFSLSGQELCAMDSGFNHLFGFNEAVSLIVECENQEEIDYFWNKLSAVPEAEQCGWLKDKYGVSWQIVPKQMNEMMSSATPEQMKRLTESFLKMKKFDLAELQKAFEG